MTEKKIVYFSPYFWPESIGSAPYCTDVARYLAERGHDVHVVAFRPHYPREDEFTAWAGGERDQEDYSGVHIYRIPARGRGAGGFKDRLRNDLSYVFGALRFGFRREVKGADAVVAYVPSCLSLFAAKFVAFRTGAKLICVVHDIESGLARSLGIAVGGSKIKVMQIIERLAFSQADKLIVLTKGMLTEIEALGCRRPITVLPIWASVAKSNPIDAAQRPSVLYSGNFGKKQALNQLLPLIKLLDDRRPDVKVILRGAGSELEKVKAEVAAMKVNNTEFLPLVPSEQLVETMQEATVHLVPQALGVANYALPSKLFTIMSAGRPFVCISEPGSPPDLLSQESGAGLCVHPDDDEGLFSAVDKLISDLQFANQLGENGRNYVATNMDREKIMQAYEHLILSGAATARNDDSTEEQAVVSSSNP